MFILMQVIIIFDFLIHYHDLLDLNNILYHEFLIHWRPLVMTCFVPMGNLVPCIWLVNTLYGFFEFLVMFL